MNFVLFIVLAVCAYILFTKAEGWLVSWSRKRSDVIDGNERVGILAFFAGVGIVSTAIQLIVWLVKGAAYVMHLLLM